MRKSSQRSSQIETFEKMLLMSASGIDGLADIDFLEGSDVDEVQAVEFPVPFGESVFADIPEATPEPLSSNEAFLDRVVELTNAVRAASGLQSLTANSTLQIAAQLQSANMAEQDFFSHTGQDGLMAWDRALNEGYNYQTIGENIAAGQLTPDEVVQGWVNSPGHLANILNPRFTEIGVGYQYLQSDTGVINYHHYWTQVFGTEFPSVEEPVTIIETPEDQEPVEEASAVDVPPPSVDVEPPTNNVEPAAAASPVEEFSPPPPPLEVLPAAELNSPAVEAETAAEPFTADTVEVAFVADEADEPITNAAQPAPIDAPPPAVDNPPPIEAQPPVDDTEAVSVTPAIEPPVNVAPAAPPVEPQPQPETVEGPSNDTMPLESAGTAVPAPRAEVTPAATTPDEVAIAETLSNGTHDRATAIEKLTEKCPVAIQKRVVEFATRLTNMAEVNFFNQAAQHQLEFSSRSQAADGISQMINNRFTAEHSWLDDHNTGSHSNHVVSQVLDGFRVKREDADDDHELSTEPELTADSIL